MEIESIETISETLEALENDFAEETILNDEQAILTEETTYSEVVTVDYTIQLTNINTTLEKTYTVVWLIGLILLLRTVRGFFKWY